MNAWTEKKLGAVTPNSVFNKSVWSRMGSLDDSVFPYKLCLLKHHRYQLEAARKRPFLTELWDVFLETSMRAAEHICNLPPFAPIPYMYLTGGIEPPR